MEIVLETERDKYKKTEKLKALKTQTNLYKDDKVLDISKHLLIFSKKGKPLSFLELAINSPMSYDLNHRKVI